MLTWFALLAVGVVSLVPGRQVSQTIASGEIRSFRLDVSSGQFVNGVIDQGETDLTVTLFSPNGQRLARFDGRGRGVERISFLAERGGRYRLDVQTAAKPVRRTAFRVRFDQGRPSTPDDARVIDAEGLGTEAKELFSKGDGDSLRLALERGQRALSLWQGLHNRAEELTTLVSVGDALYRLTEYENADRAFRQALVLSDELRDQRTGAEVRNNLAAIAWPLGNVPEAIALLRQALDLWRAIRFPYGEASALSNLGGLLMQAGEFDEARQQLDRALVILRRLGERRGEAYALSNMAQVLDTLGARQEALRSLRRVALLFRETADHLAEGGALVRLARIQLALGQRRAALANVNRGLVLIRRSPDRLAEAGAMELVGHLHAAAGDLVRAREQYEVALALYRTVGSRKGQSDALHAIGLTHLAAGDGRTALTLLEPALDWRRMLGLRSLEVETLVRMVEAERLTGDLERARTHAETALVAAEQLRSGIFERELRTSYSSSLQRYYGEYIDLLMDLHRRQPERGFDRMALEAVERARARGLVELLRESWAGAIGPAHAPLLRRERELREQLAYWSWQVWQQAEKPAGGTRETSVRAKVESLLAEHERAEADLRRAEPRIEAALRPQPLSLQTIQQELLDEQTVLLEYQLGERRSFLWSITGDGVSVAQLPGRAAIERGVRRYYRMVGTSPEQSTGVASVDQREREAAGLSRLLLSPAAASLGKRRMFIVADGVLHYVPFSALPSPGRRTALVVDHEIVSLPSATMVVLLRRELSSRKPAPHLLAILADPVFPGDARITPTATTTPRLQTPERVRRLGRLPLSGREADRIFELCRSRRCRKAVGFDANRALATSPQMSDYRYVHFATHALTDDEHPELSGIVLSLVDRAGVGQNGFLRVQDLYGLHLHADLVVLSACETAVGKQVGGEGLISVSRGFFYAGAARVMATLWRVDDTATSTFMALFYRALLGDTQRSPAAALRAAQTAMRADKRWSDPYYWSGFVLQGES